VAKRLLSIETNSGVKELEIFTDGHTATSVKANVGRAELRPDQIPVNFPGDSVISVPVDIGGALWHITCVSMGNPHVVTFVDNVERLDLPTIGPLFENNTLFPDRINTEFIEILGNNRLKMRVWERGSGETMACGTGACASAVAAVLNGHCSPEKDIIVELRGGELTIHYTSEAVFMTGDCNRVFDGEVYI